MRLAIFLLALPALAQIQANFSPQPSSPCPTLTMYAVNVCTDGGSVILSGGKLYAAAAAYIIPVTRSGLLEEYRQQARRSPWRYFAWTLELAGGGLTIATQSKTNIIKEQWKTGIPAATAAILLIDKSVKSQIPVGAVPDNIVPPIMQVPERGCVEAVMFAGPQQGEKPFSVEVKP